MPQVTQLKGGLSAEGSRVLELYALLLGMAHLRDQDACSDSQHFCGVFVCLFCFLILVSMEFPSLLPPTISGEPVLVVRTSKEPSKKFLELYNLYFPDSNKDSGRGLFFTL